MQGKPAGYTIGQIERFNPYAMADADITYLATGREIEQETIFNAVAENKKRADANQHLMIVGPRGMGKSFLIQLIKINISRQFPELLIAQLPEEQSNIRGPASFLDVITQTLSKAPRQQQFARFIQEESKAWDTSLQALRKLLAGRKTISPDLQAIVTIENFDILLERCFKSRVDESKFRAMLAEETGLMFVVSTLRGDLDQESNNRLFHAFNHIRLKPWNDAQLEKYFRKRRGNDQFTPEIKARYQAVVQFVGGSPRMAVILNDLIDTIADPISGAKLLDRFTDELTPYYQDLMRLMPSNSEVLFDALIRGGEPCSQSELASRVGTSQNRIAQSFAWLRDREIVFGEWEKGGKALLFRVADRLFVQYFRKRYIYFDAWNTPLMAITELLEKLYTATEKLRLSQNYYEKIGHAEGELMGMLYLRDVGVATENFPIGAADKKQLFRLLDQKTPFSMDSYASAEEAQKDLESLYSTLCATLRKNKIGTAETSGKILADLVRESLLLSFEEKMRIISAAIKWLRVEQIDEISYLLMLGNTDRDTLTDSDIKEMLSHILSDEVDFSKHALDESRFSFEAHSSVNRFYLNYVIKLVWEQKLDLALNMAGNWFDFAKRGNDTDQIIQARCKIAWVYNTLYDYQKAYEILHEGINEQCDEPLVKAALFDMLGWTLWEKQDVEKAVDYFQQSLQLVFENDGYKHQISYVSGHLAGALLTIKQYGKAWKIVKQELKENASENLTLFRSFSDAIYFVEKHHGRVVGFAMAQRIFDWVSRQRDFASFIDVVQGMVTNMFEMGNSLQLMRDIISEAVTLSGKHQEIALIANAADIALRYVCEDRDDAAIQRVDPDLKILVKALTRNLAPKRLGN